MGGDITVRPSFRKFVRGYGGYVTRSRAFLAMCGTLVLFSLLALSARGHGHIPLFGLNATILAIAFLVPMACGLVAIPVYFLTNRLYIKGDRIGKGSLLRRTEYPVNRVGRVVRCLVTYGLGICPNRSHFVLDRKGRVLFSLLMMYWDETSLEPLWRRLGVEPEGSWSDAIPYEALGKRFPDA
jgi:hypothetical protein